MKRFLALTLVLVLVLAAFVGCKKPDTTDKNGQTTAAATEKIDDTTAAATEKNADTTAAATEMNAETTAQQTAEAPVSESIIGWYKAETINGMTLTEYLSSMFSGMGGDGETAESMSEEDMKSALEKMGIDLDNFMSMELMADGTAELSSMGVITKATWTMDGETVTITSKDGTEQKGTFDGTRLTLKEDSELMEMTVVFVKSEKPAEPEVDPELLNNDPNNIVGIYHVSKINDQTLEEYVQDAAKESGVDVETFLEQNAIDLENYLPMTIRSDNTVEMKMFSFKMTGTWTLDGEKLTIVMGEGEDADTTTGTFANGEIVIGDEDQMITYVKN